MNTLYGLIHVSYTRDERDTVAYSILFRVTISPNAHTQVTFETLFVGAQCATLFEGNKVIWSPDITVTNSREFFVENDSTDGLITNLFTTQIEKNSGMIFFRENDWIVTSSFANQAVTSKRS